MRRRRAIGALCGLLMCASHARAQSLTLTWTDNSDNEEGFRCERQVDGGSFAQACEVGPNVQTWHDTTVAFDVTYCYRVLAWNSAGSSPYSNTACGTPTAATPDVLLQLSCTQTPEAADPSLVLALALNETSGLTATDTSGLNNHGVLSGATWTTSGKYGGALSFDGVNDWVTIADVASLDLTNGLTIEAWVFPTATIGVRDILIKEGSNVDIYNLYAYNWQGRPESNVFVGGSNRVAEGTALPADVWSHIAGTYGNGTLRLFVNGVQVASTAVTGSITTSTGPLRIGGNNLWPNEFFQGRIDNVRLYNRALSQAELQTAMHTAIP